jgi:hypothetical protein
MIIGLAIIGLLLIAVALKGTEHELAQRLQADLLGTDGFIAWIAAIVALGAVGYIPGLETASNYLLALLMVVVVVRNGGIWAQLQTALQAASAAGPAPSVAPRATTLDPQSSSSGGGSGGSSGSSDASTAISTVATIAEVAAVLA